MAIMVEENGGKKKRRALGDLRGVVCCTCTRTPW